jgi:imidazole glycerol-phosphate synthase subunit HisF
MLRARIIPCLLLSDHGLVKTRKFRQPIYIGDPINTVRIFNDKECDEIVLLDIGATKLGREPNYTLIQEVAGECFMPISYGGGITRLEQVKRIIRAGVEKVVVNSAATTNLSLISEIAAFYGSQAVVVSIDVTKSLFGKWSVRSHGGTQKTSLELLPYLQRVIAAGAGEILLNNIDRDGEMVGYDLDLVQQVTGSCTVPVIACGGAGKLGHLASVLAEGGAAAAAAGSLFVYQGPHRAVLINYPDKHFFANLAKRT